MWGDARMAARRLAWERLARSLLSCVSSSHRSNSVGPNLPGAAFPAPPGTCGLGSGASFSPQAAGSVAEKLRPAGTGPRGRCQPAQVRARTRPGLRRFSPSQSFYTPTGASHVCQGGPTGYLRSIGQVVAGFAAVPVPAVGKVDFAGLAPAGRAPSGR